jgi:hypothetical protein
MIRDEEMIRDKISYYNNNSIPIHIILNNSRFYNGSVVRIEETSIIFKEDFLGEIVVYLSEIKNIERQRPRT